MPPSLVSKVQGAPRLVGPSPGTAPRLDAGASGAGPGRSARHRRTEEVLAEGHAACPVRWPTSSSDRSWRWCADLFWQLRVT